MPSRKRKARRRAKSSPSSGITRAACASSIVAGGPRDWFEPYGWDVYEAENGSEWAPVCQAILEMTHGNGTALRPRMMFGKTIKGRGYHKIDAPSHGSPHAMNSELFWKCRADFTEKYGVTWYGTDESAPADADERALLWKARKSAFGAVAQAAPDYYLHDTVVPRARLADPSRVRLRRQILERMIACSLPFPTSRGGCRSTPWSASCATPWWRWASPRWLRVGCRRGWERHAGRRPPNAAKRADHHAPRSTR